MSGDAARQDVVLGIDVGTSKLKVLAFDLSGRVAAEVSATTPLHMSGTDCVEADPEEWWRVLVTSLRKLVVRADADAGLVRGLGMCGAMHSVVLVDGSGRSMGRVPLWADQRYRLHGPVGGRTEEISGGPSATACLGRLRWQLDGDGDVRERVRLLLPLKDFLRYRLTGTAACDPFEAVGTGLAEPNGRKWSEPLVDSLDLPHEVLPAIVEPDEVAGTVCGAAAEETGLLAGTPVVAGTGDWHAALLGSAAWLPRSAALCLGTAGTLGAFKSVHDFDRFAEPVCFGAVTSTGSALQWAGRALLPQDGAAEETPSARVVRLAARSEPGARGITFLPHLMGERGGADRPDASGTLAGLRLVHGPEDVARGVLEGTAAWLRLVASPSLEAHPFESLVASGDGARADLSLEIAAALYDRPVVVPEVVEAGALAAAQLAAHAIGATESLRGGAVSWLRTRRVVEPDPQLVEAYHAVFERFSRTEATLRLMESREGEGGRGCET